MGVGARCVAAPSPQRQRSEGTKISSTFRPQPGLNQRFVKKFFFKGGLNQRFEKKLQNTSVGVDFKPGVDTT